MTDEQLRLAVREVKKTLLSGGSAVHLPADSWIEEAVRRVVAVTGTASGAALAKAMESLLPFTEHIMDEGPAPEGWRSDACLAAIKAGEKALEDFKAAPPVAVVPLQPTLGLLMSMALRYDHGLGCPGYYDVLPRYPGDTHRRRLESTLCTMRQLHEEVVGTGFYQPDREDRYEALAEQPTLNGLSERELRERLACLAREYEAAAEPLTRALVQFAAMRPPADLYLNIKDKPE